MAPAAAERVPGVGFTRTKIVFLRMEITLKNVISILKCAIYPVLVMVCPAEFATFASGNARVTH